RRAAGGVFQQSEDGTGEVVLVADFAPLGRGGEGLRSKRTVTTWQRRGDVRREGKHADEACVYAAPAARRAVALARGLGLACRRWCGRRVGLRRLELVSCSAPSGRRNAGRAGAGL